MISEQTYEKATQATEQLLGTSTVPARYAAQDYLTGSLYDFTPDEIETIVVNRTERIFGNQTADQAVYGVEVARKSISEIESQGDHDV